MSLPKQITSKLFYGKWSFKIKCICAGSWMIKRLGVGETLKYCLDPGNALPPTNWYSRRADPKLLMSFLNDVEPFLNKDISIRVEGSIFSIYCNDEKLFNSMCKKLKSWITMIYTPANDIEHEFMLEGNNKKVLCNHIPFDTYPYKVHIKTSMDANTRDKFSSWIKNYTGKIQATDHTKLWLDGTKKWAQNPCLYVIDKPTLMMVGLFLGNKLSKVEEFIPRSSINTLPEQEEPCQV